MAVIYVSTDTDAKTAAVATSSLPWFRMTFNDDSDFAALATNEPEPIASAREEEFVQAAVSMPPDLADDRKSRSKPRWCHTARKRRSMNTNDP